MVSEGGRTSDEAIDRRGQDHLPNLRQMRRICCDRLRRKPARDSRIDQPRHPLRLRNGELAPNIPPANAPAEEPVVVTHEEERIVQRPVVQKPVKPPAPTIPPIAPIEETPDPTAPQVNVQPH